MAGAAAAEQAFERLKGLIVGDLAHRVAGLEPRVEKIDSFVSDPKTLETATARVLVDALRAAEVERHAELASVLAPLVVSAIRAEIKNSKEMMIEALYPITGRLVTAAVANAFRDLVDTMNQRIDRLVSADVWSLRLRAFLTGRSMAEIALADADSGRLKRALLLERGSGHVLASWPAPGPADNPELASGLIAAITEFAAAVYADSGGELRNLDLGASKVFLRASARVIAAGEFMGELTGDREKRLDDAFLSLVESHERDNAAIDGPAIGARLAEALAEPKKVSSRTPVKIVAAVAAALAVWFSIAPATRALRERRIRTAYDAAAARLPALADFPLRLDIDHGAGRVTLRGLAQDETGPRTITEDIAAAALPYAVARDVKVVVIAPPGGALPADGARTGAKISDLERALAQDHAARDAAFERLRRRIETFAVFFTAQDALIDSDAAATGLDDIAALLKESGAALRVVGYADESGGAGANRIVSRRRAEKVAALLIERGALRDALVIVPRATLAPISDQGQQAARSRRVVFELPYEHELERK